MLKYCYIVYYVLFPFENHSAAQSEQICSLSFQEYLGVTRLNLLCSESVLISCRLTF